MRQTRLQPFKRKRDVEDEVEAAAEAAGPSQPSQAPVIKGRVKRSIGQKGWTDLGKGCRVGFWPRHITASRAQQMMMQLEQELQWEQKDVVIMGRTLPQPRLVAYYADDTSSTYIYSGLKLQPLAFTPLLDELRKLAEQLSNDTYNSVLCNLYRDGADSMGWHADNEKYYAPECSIASISFGGPREFIMRCNEDHSRQIGFHLGYGDVLVMAGATQQHWQHAVPKRAPASKYGPRINLTFRKVVYPVPAGKK